MNSVIPAILACLAGVGGVGLGAQGGSEATPTPPAFTSTKGDITCTLLSCEGWVKTTFGNGSGEPRTDRRLTVSAIVTAPRDAPPLRVVGMNLVELRDAQGRNLLGKEAKSGEARAPIGRRELAEQLNAAMRSNSETRQHVGDSVRGLRELPREIASVRAEINVLTSGKVVREAVPLRVQEEATEVVPGLTFLMTRAETHLNRFTLGFEVRTRRHREGDAGKPGNEPVFAGLCFYGADGQLVNVVNYGQEVETRDEYILVVKDAVFDAEYVKRSARVEVVVFSDVGTVTFEVGAEGFPLNHGE